MQEGEGNSSPEVSESKQDDKGVPAQRWPGLQCVSPVLGVRDLAGCRGPVRVQGASLRTQDLR